MTFAARDQQKHKKLSVIHLVPYDCIGGVETAARTMMSVEDCKMKFDVNFIYPDSAIIENNKALYNPLYLIKSAHSLIKQKPDVLIVSLWRSYAVGVLVKLLFPKLKLITFLHLPKDAHIVDYILSRLSSRLSEKIWADSQTTKVKRLPEKYQCKIDVISFLTHPHEILPNRTLRPNFIFWGRLHSQKNLERSIFIFSEVKKIVAAAKFFIIGPDGGELKKITKKIEDFNLTGSVQVLGGKNFEEIRACATNASFYLQTSHDEGMAMSVIEAMQLGLVPIVTPVGEIASYCADDVNALIISDDIVGRIIDLLDSPQKFDNLSKSAAQQWLKQESYKSSVIANLTKLVS